MHKATPLLLLLTLACDPGIPLETSTEPVIRGTVDFEHTAVGRLGHTRNNTLIWMCTATLIGPSTVLTAAHCLFDEQDKRITAPRLRFGLDDGRARTVASSFVITSYEPGSYGEWDDIALLSLDRPVEDEAPIPVSGQAPELGEASVVGFGVTRATGPHRGVGGGTRRRGSIDIQDVSEKELSYPVQPSGACYGDSGGPILQEVGGRPVLVGVTSRGDHTYCLGTDIATRADAFKAWISTKSRGDACIDRCE